MAVGNVVVLDHNNGVAVGLKEGAQAGNAGIGILVQQELGAVAVLDVLDLHQSSAKTPLPAASLDTLGLAATSAPAMISPPSNTCFMPSKISMMP